MRAHETMFETDAASAEGVEGRVSLWADSVGEAAAQLGLVVTCAIALHLAINLLSGFSRAWH